MNSAFEIILTFIVLGFWVLFPIAIFMAVNYSHAHPNEGIKLGPIENETFYTEDRFKEMKASVRSKRKSRYSHAFRKWIRH